MKYWKFTQLGKTKHGIQNDLKNQVPNGGVVITKEEYEAATGIESKVTESDKPKTADNDVLKQDYPHKTAIKKLKSEKLIDLARQLNIETSPDDLKKDIFQKVLTYFETNIWAIATKG